MMRRGQQSVVSRTGGSASELLPKAFTTPTVNLR